MFNTVLSAVDMGGNGKVEAIILSNKAGLTAYKAKVYVDCTGDADLAVWAGCEYVKGDESGELQPTTHCFILSNVDDYAYKYGPILHAQNLKSPIFDIVNSGKYPLIPDVHLCNSTIGPGTVGFNAGHLWNVDNTDPISVSKALMQGRKIAASIRDALTEYHPKDKVKEVNTGNQEIHFGYNKGESHGIPYRCLLPKGIKNVLVAGRSISCERIVQGSVRIMPACLVMGEAAGMAAAHALKLSEPDVHKVNTNYLRKRLKEEGAYLV